MIPRCEFTQPRTNLFGHLCTLLALTCGVTGGVDHRSAKSLLSLRTSLVRTTCLMMGSSRRYASPTRPPRMEQKRKPEAEREWI